MPSKVGQSIEDAFALWILINQSVETTYRARKKELSQYGITVRESAILFAIDTLGETATPAKLARSVYRKPHTIAVILKNMEKKNLIKLRKDTDIKNIVRIDVTEKGKLANEQSLKRTSIHRIFKGLDDETYRQLVLVHTQIRDRALKQTGESILDYSIKKIMVSRESE